MAMEPAAMGTFGFDIAGNVELAGSVELLSSIETFGMELPSSIELPTRARFEGKPLRVDLGGANEQSWNKKLCLWLR
jgi:hypothetical protein